MREIIYRGKSVKTGEWVFGCYQRFSHFGKITHCIKHSSEMTYEVIPETVGQYTGLKDKNGKMIFEGDRVIIPNDLWIGNNNVGGAKGTFKKDAFIEYYKGSFRVNKVGDESKMYYGVIDLSKNTMGYSMEVIGNIHDNSELINK